MKYSEVYNIVVPESKRNEEKYNIMTHWLMRPLSIFLTMPFIKTKIKPITITKWSILFSILGFGLISFSTNLLVQVGGWLCILMWALLDCVDGNLARCQNKCSQLGDLWDTMGGYLAMIFIYFSAGIAAFSNENIITLLDPHWYIIIGGFTAIMSIFPRLIMHKKKSYNSESASVKELSDKKNFSLKKIIMMNFISPTGFLIFLFLFAIIFNLLNLFIIFYMFINFAIMVVSLYSLLKE